jgi:hypothetical protein
LRLFIFVILNPGSFAPFYLCHSEPEALRISIFVILNPGGFAPFYLCHSEPPRLCAGAKNLGAIEKDSSLRSEVVKKSKGI